MTIANWIPCEWVSENEDRATGYWEAEQLPDINEPVLVTLIDGSVTHDTFCRIPLDREGNPWNGFSFEYGQLVVAWAPLPLPYSPGAPKHAELDALVEVCRSIAKSV